jgi:hypothetical protein
LRPSRANDRNGVKGGGAEDAVPRCANVPIIGQGTWFIDEADRDESVDAA